MDINTTFAVAIVATTIVAGTIFAMLTNNGKQSNLAGPLRFELDTENRLACL